MPTSKDSSYYNYNEKRILDYKEGKFSTVSVDHTCTYQLECSPARNQTSLALHLKRLKKERKKIIITNLTFFPVYWETHSSRSIQTGTVQSCLVCRRRVHLIKQIAGYDWTLILVSELIGGSTLVCHKSLSSRGLDPVKKPLRNTCVISFWYSLVVRWYKPSLQRAPIEETWNIFVPPWFVVITITGCVRLYNAVHLTALAMARVASADQMCHATSEPELLRTR